MLLTEKRQLNYTKVMKDENTVNTGDQKHVSVKNSHKQNWVQEKKRARRVRYWYRLWGARPSRQMKDEDRDLVKREKFR
jgi:hypothetical protein